MKVSLEVKDRKEADAVRRAWSRPDLRAMIIIVGTLDGLPTDRARARVLQYTVDKIAEERAAKFDA